jgi:hypothetical protein
MALTVHIRTRQTRECIEAQGRVFYEYWSIDKLGSPAALGCRHLFNGTLDLLDIKRMALNFDARLKDSLYFSEFVGISGYKVEFRAHDVAVW